MFPTGNIRKPEVLSHFQGGGGGGMGGAGGGGGKKQNIDLKLVNLSYIPIFKKH